AVPAHGMADKGDRLAGGPRFDQRDHICDKILRRVTVCGHLRSPMPPEIDGKAAMPCRESRELPAPVMGIAGPSVQKDNLPLPLALFREEKTGCAGHKLGRRS